MDSVVLKAGIPEIQKPRPGILNPGMTTIFLSLCKLSALDERLWGWFWQIPPFFRQWSKNFDFLITQIILGHYISHIGAIIYLVPQNQLFWPLWLHQNFCGYVRTTYTYDWDKMAESGDKHKRTLLWFNIKRACCKPDGFAVKKPLHLHYFLSGPFKKKG